MSDRNKHPRDVAVVGRGIQPSHVRLTNQRAILSVISLQPGISNAELARVTDLAPQTVSAVLTDLEQLNLVTRGEVLRGRRGQPATPLYMNPVGAMSIGAEIGWRHMEVCLVGIGTQVLRRIRRDYDFPDAGTIFTELASIVADLTASLSPMERKQLVGLGLAAPGGLGNPDSLLKPPAGQEELWAGVDIAGAVATATGLEVSLFNDGHAACWAQRVAHPAPRPLSFVFLVLDTFVGAGIVAENRLWEGHNGTSANLGAMLVTDRDGHMRYLHEVASLHALEQRLGAAGLGLDDVRQVPVAAAVRPVLDAWIAEASDALAQTLMNTTRVMEFEQAVIESALPPVLTAEIVAATRQRMERFPTLALGAQVPVESGQLGRSGAAQGAALLRMHRRFFSRELAHMDV
ncbi:MAG: ROK family transcriptional regulator [Devosia sp.]